MKGEKASRGKRTSGKREVGVRQGITRGGSRIFKRGGGTNECRRYELSREVWGHAPPPEIFENLSL